MTFASGLSFPEGPVALADRSWLCVEGGPERGCVTQISSDGKTKRIVAKTGRPNGLAVDTEGYIWVAESKTPSLLRLTLDGKTEVVATACDGKPFLFPNDLCLGLDGGIYLTDSGVHIDEFAPGGKIRSDYLQAKYDGRIYRVDTKSGKVRLLDSGIKFTNGIAFGPDRALYANETLTGMIYRYEWEDGDNIGPRQGFGNVIDPNAPPGWKGPDGMAFGLDGNLYVAVFAQQDITVLGRDGSVVKRLRTQGKLPTNCAFGLPGQKKLYVTEYEFGQIEVFDLETDGLPLYA
ncbi:MAG: SMP-30/gluconolactonase/LRE family protein [Terriglobia bacterium]